MFGLGPATRIYVALGATDMRKGYDGLYGLVRDKLGLDLYSFVPTAANAAYYIDIVREKQETRPAQTDRLISACSNLATQCYDQQSEIDPLLDEAEKEIFAITGEHVKTEIIVPTKILVMEAIEQIEKLNEKRGSGAGLLPSTACLSYGTAPRFQRCPRALPRRKPFLPCVRSRFRRHRSRG